MFSVKEQFAFRQLWKKFARGLGFVCLNCICMYKDFLAEASTETVESGVCTILIFLFLGNHLYN